jgi:hypothetical protein
VSKGAPANRAGLLRLNDFIENVKDFFNGFSFLTSSSLVAALLFGPALLSVL